MSLTYDRGTVRCSWSVPDVVGTYSEACAFAEHCGGALVRAPGGRYRAIYVEQTPEFGQPTYIPGRGVRAAGGTYLAREADLIRRPDAQFRWYWQATARARPDREAAREARSWRRAAVTEVAS